ncbi:hypothetical protein BRPE64_ECDS02690 (plasmid) [Caballeronia insecticola]|uniref:Uncharacterized protein n=1 Tax=Caballeronia insecticola TaxID=758793 RepID=A0A060PKQ6_9BURK|nr:hypothetical protein BRPE64_ECDS02690 [Caballeronia insecticola]
MPSIRHRLDFSHLDSVDEIAVVSGGSRHFNDSTYATAFAREDSKAIRDLLLFAQATAAT